MAQGFLKNAGYHDVHEAPSGEVALDIERSFDLVITDYRMTGMNGGEFIRERRKRAQASPFLLLSGDPDAEMAALQLDASYLAKPPSMRKFLATVDSLLSRSDADPN